MIEEEDLIMREADLKKNYLSCQSGLADLLISKDANEEGIGQ